MPLNLDQMIEMVRKPIGVESDEMEDSEALRYLNRSYWELMDKFPFREKERVATFNTVAGTRVYSMPPLFEYLNGVAITNPETGKHEPLNQIPHIEYETKYDEDEDKWDIPVDYKRESCYITLLPTPDKIYPITIKRNIVLEDISQTNPISPIPQVWHEIIGFGGLWRAYIDFGDHGRSIMIKGHQTALIETLQPTEAKEESSDTRFAHVEVPGLEY